MEKFLENSKEELNKIGEIQPMITVERSDLENLIHAYENLKLIKSVITKKR